MDLAPTTSLIYIYINGGVCKGKGTIEWGGGGGGGGRKKKISKSKYAFTMV